MHRRRRAEHGNALRAAVLGVDDGLVSSFGLTMGVAGAGGDQHAIAVAGIAGLLAGAISMALGEWLSVQSARELYARELARGETVDVDPRDLGGSAYVAAATSFVMFAVGAVIPVMPYLLLGPRLAIGASAVLSGVSLFTVRALITLMTGRHPLWAGLRQLAIGVGAAAATFAIGRALGVAVS